MEKINYFLLLQMQCFPEEIKKLIFGYFQQHEIFLLTKIIPKSKAARFALKFFNKRIRVSKNIAYLLRDGYFDSVLFLMDKYKHKHLKLNMIAFGAAQSGDMATILTVVKWPYFKNKTFYGLGDALYAGAMSVNNLQLAFDLEYAFPNKPPFNLGVVEPNLPTYRRSYVRIRDYDYAASIARKFNAQRSIEYLISF